MCNVLSTSCFLDENTSTSVARFLIRIGVFCACVVVVKRDTQEGIDSSVCGFFLEAERVSGQTNLRHYPILHNGATVNHGRT